MLSPSDEYVITVALKAEIFPHRFGEFQLNSVDVVSSPSNPIGGSPYSGQHYAGWEIRCLLSRVYANHSLTSHVGFITFIPLHQLSSMQISDTDITDYIKRLFGGQTPPVSKFKKAFPNSKRIDS